MTDIVQRLRLIDPYQVLLAAPPHDTSYLQVGLLCHEAATEIERLRAEVLAEREACIRKIQTEIDHALMNDLRLEVKFGQARGDRAVRMSALEASLDWLRDRGEKP